MKNRKRKLMLWWIAGVLMFSGLAGLVTSYRMEGVISIALVLVVAIALVGLIRGRWPCAGWEV
jgi:cytochrome c oxidase subunit IV